MRSFKSITRALLLTAGAASIAAAQSTAPRPLHYWHVWVDSAGTSHQTQSEFKHFSPLSLGRGVEPIFTDKLPDKPDHVVVRGWRKCAIGSSPQAAASLKTSERYRIIPLSGRWYVETMDGHRVEMGPGDASLGEDQGSKPDAAGHTGHLSLGDAPITLMFVQLDHKALNDVCRNK